MVQRVDSAEMGAIDRFAARHAGHDASIALVRSNSRAYADFELEK